jgi:hypothetical protein
MKANEYKSTRFTFTLKRDNCPTVTLNGNQIPQGETARYLGIYLDKRLVWRTHIFAKRKQLGLKFQQIYFILERKSEPSIKKDTNLQNYSKAHLDIRYTPLEHASNSNIEILQRYKNKVLRAIVNASSYITMS